MCLVISIFPRMIFPYLYILRHCESLWLHHQWQDDRWWWNDDDSRRLAFIAACLWNRQYCAFDVLTGLGDVYPSETGSSPAGQEIKTCPRTVKVYSGAQSAFFYSVRTKSLPSRGDRNVKLTIYSYLVQELRMKTVKTSLAPMP